MVWVKKGFFMVWRNLVMVVCGKLGYGYYYGVMVKGDLKVRMGFGGEGILLIVNLYVEFKVFTYYALNIFVPVFIHLIR